MPPAVVTELAASGVERGSVLGLAFAEGVGVGLAAGGQTWSVAAADPIAVIAGIEEAVGPRWTWWGRGGVDRLVSNGLRVKACWDVGAVHQMLFGGSAPGAAAAWAHVHGLPTDQAPRSGQLNLLDAAGEDGGDPEVPVRADGYLRPEWVDGGWRRTPVRLALLGSGCARVRRSAAPPAR